jgi:hypothetical protein
MKPGSFVAPALLITLIVTVLFVVSCGKSNNGHPSISLESVNTTVQPHDSMRCRFKFSDGKAISGANLEWIRTRLNQTPPQQQSGPDTTGYPLPSFSGNTGEIYISLPWDGYLNTASPVNDTLIFKFFVTNSADSALTDTVTSPQIVVIFQ